MARLPDHVEMRRHRAGDTPGLVAYRLRLHLAALKLPCHDHGPGDLVDDHEYPLAERTGPLASGEGA